MGDDPNGIHWINSDLIGLKQKMKNIKKERLIQRIFFSSGTMGVYNNIGRGVLYAVIVVFCVIPKIRKANLINSVK